MTDYSIIAARTPAWGRLGAEFTDNLTIAEALDQGGLAGWNVRGVPAGALLDPTDPLSWVPVPDRVYPVRDTATGPARLGQETVTTGFQFWQNEQVGEFAQQVAGLFGDEKIVTTAGYFRDGTQMFLCLELEGFTVLGDDAHDQYLTVANGHDGSLSLTGTTGGTRVVCRNTFEMAVYGQANRVTVKHQGDMIAKAGEAAEVLGVARDWAKAYGQFAESLAAQKMSDRQFETVVRKNFVPKPADDAGLRTKNRAERDFEALMAGFKVSDTTATGRGTKWGALNAITEWAEWGRPGDLSTEKAAVANLFGTGKQLREKAVRVLTA